MNYGSIVSIPSYDKDRESAPKVEKKLPFKELSKKFPYHQVLEELVEKAHKIATVARKKRLDPVEEVEIYRAEDVASRTEGLVGPKGVAKRLREMEFIEKLPKEKIVIKIAEEIALGKFGDMPPRDLAEQAIRTALSVQTEGITAAPIEGISKVKIKQNVDGSSYLAIYYSGPIRSAGGTAQGVSVLIADHVRKTLGLDRYKATDQEAERMLEEVRAYNAKVHLQLPTSDEEIRFAWKNLPVMISGDPTEPEEVSGYRNIESMETNRIRGGACLVLNDGVVGRAKKLVKRIKKIGLEGWGWLERISAGEFSEFKEKKKKKDENSSQEKTGNEQKDKPIRYEASPDTAFLADAISGRPIFAGATQPGGFRLRYGHARNTGIAGIGIHPATYGVFNDFLAPGTHVRTERPGKGSIVAPVNTIRPPIIKLQSGDVIEVKTYQQGINLFPLIEKILFVGDLLIGYGEFVQNNYKLVPAGFNEEWWAQILKESGNEHYLPDVHPHLLTKYLSEHPPSEIEAIDIAKKTGTPLHPKYVPAWKYISATEASQLRNEILNAKSNLLSPNIKPILEKALITHKIDSETKKIKVDFFITLRFQLTGQENDDDPISDAPDSCYDGLDFIQKTCPVPILDTMGTTLGARMGRPEKAKPRLMQPARHGLFPLGNIRGVGTDLKKAENYGTINVALADRYCHNCDLPQYERFCIKCTEPTELRGRCIKCGATNDEGPCDVCGGRVTNKKRYDLDIPKILNQVRSRIGEIPQKVKLIEELKNPTYTPEIIEKGILRAKYGLHVFRDGTIRYDATDAPLTHFKPKEIETSIEKLIELGYDTDIEGKPLENEDQILAIKPQDIIVNQNFKEHAFNVAKFIDDLLKYVYKMEPFYNLKSPKDIVGHLIIGLAPHTSAGVIGRVIGFTTASVCWAHPFWHSAKRRNCVAYEHEIPLFNEKTNELEIHTIGQLVDHIQSYSKGKIVDAFGTTEFENPLTHLKAISLDEKTHRITLEPIKKWIKGETEYWVKITTNSGTELIMTPNHRQLVFKNGKVIRKKASELQPNDLLPTPAKIMLPTSPTQKLNLLETFSKRLPRSHEFNQFRNSLRLRNAPIIQQTILQRTTKEQRKHLTQLMPLTGSKPFTKRWFNSIPLSHIEVLVSNNVISWNEIPKNASLGIARNAKTTPAFIDLDPQFFRFLGLYTAEGFVRNSPGTYQINIGNTTPEIKNEIEMLSLKFCGKPYAPKNFHNVVNANKIISYLIAFALKAGTSALNKRIPSIVFSQPIQNKLAYLSGIIDGDGSIVTQNKAVQIYTANKKLAHDYRLLLSTLGYKAKISSVAGKRFGNKVLQRYKQLNKIPNSKGILYHIIIYDHDLLQKINLKHPKKMQKAKQILQNPRKSSKTSFSNDIFLDPIKSIKIIKKKQATYCAEIDSKNHNLVFLNSPITSNCDGDEDGIVLLMDGFLNFSKEYLPTTRGSKMDAPLVLVTKLNPLEVDDEAFNLDFSYAYPTSFYSETLKGSVPSKLPVPRIEDVLGTLQQFQNVPYTHYTDDIAIGPLVTKYKIIPTMKDKLYAQMDLAEIISAVDAKFVAEQVLKRHFIPDLMGNLRSFAKQGVYCGTCRAKYRRVPLTGKCLNKKCPKPDSLRLNINPASVYKYLEIAQELIDRYQMRHYIQDRLDRIKLGIYGLFPPPEKKQLDLSDFF